MLAALLGVVLDQSGRAVAFLESPSLTRLILE